MKLAQYVLILMTIIGLSACGGTDEDLLVGTWELSELNYAGNISTSDGSLTLSSDFSGSASDITTTITFNADGTYTTSGSHTLEFEFDFGGNPQTQTITYEAFLDSGTWELDGSTLTVTDSAGEDTSIEMRSLSNRTLILQLEITEVDDTQVATTTTTVNGNYTFEKE